MSAGETIIIYGPLTFFNVLTKYVNYEPVRDDTDTDKISNKFTISAVGHLHGLPSAVLGTLPTSGTGNAGNDLVALRYLMTDRQHFEMRLGVTMDNFGNITNPGVVIAYADPANNIGSTNVNFKDTNNGPRAQCLNVTKISANNLLECDIEFEITQLNCAPDGSTQNATGILNNRWTVIDDIDCTNWMTTRTWNGILRLSSSQVNPHSFRDKVVPPLVPGMRRASMHFQAAENGLALMYTVVDKEIAFAPPAPATTWNASFGQRAEYGDHLGHFYECNIQMGGDRYCDLKKLISIASAMAIAKFSNGILKFPVDPAYRVLSIEVYEHYSDREAGIHLRATAQRVDFQGPDMLSLNTKNLGVPITADLLSGIVAQYDSKLSRDARPGETLEITGPISLVGAACSFMQSGCGIFFGIENGIPAQVLGAPQGVPLTTVTAVVMSDIASDGSISNTYGPNNTKGIYTHATVEHEEHIDTGVVVCPVGNPTPNYTDPTQPNYVPGGPPDISQDTNVPVTIRPPSRTGISTYESERIGYPPARLNPQSSPDDERIVVRVERKTLSPAATTDGKKIYREKTTVWWCDRNVLATGSPEELKLRSGLYLWVEVDPSTIIGANGSGVTAPPPYQQGF